MGYRSTDLNSDIFRNQHKPKRIVFYGKGLKIYGLMPYLLVVQLRGQFISNYWVAETGDFMGAGIAAQTNEGNYTAVSYAQKSELVEQLLNWLMSGQGFEYAIAGPDDYGADIWKANVGQFPPAVWTPSGEGFSNGFNRMFQSQGALLHSDAALLFRAP